MSVIPHEERKPVMIIKPLKAALGILVLGAALWLAASQANACDPKEKGCVPDRNVMNQLVNLGLAMSPLPLSYDPGQRDMVGYGSFIVNSQASCFGCHTRQAIDPVYGRVHDLGGYMGGACNDKLCSIDLTPGGVPSWFDFDLFNVLVRGLDYCAFPGTMASKEELAKATNPFGPSCAPGTGGGPDYLTCMASNGVYAGGGGDCIQFNGDTWIVAGSCGSSGGSDYLQQQTCYQCGMAANGEYAGGGDILQWTGEAWMIAGPATTQAGQCLPTVPQANKDKHMFHESLQKMSNADMYAVYSYFKALPNAKSKARAQ